jgi:putative phage-type endonuclease
VIAVAEQLTPRNFNAHCVLVPITKESDERLWLEERKKSVGGTGAAPALGLSPYATTYRRWLEDTGQLDPEDISQKPAVKAGLRLEDSVADWFSDETGARLERVNGILRSKRWPFIHVSIDRRIVGADAGLECKTAGYWAGKSEEWGDSEGVDTDAVPIPYRVQCAVGRIVTGWSSWKLAVLIGGQDFRWFTIPPHPKLEKRIVTGLDAYWQTVLEARGIIADGERRGLTITEAAKRIPANLIPAPSKYSDVLLRWGQSDRKPITATREIAKLVDEFADERRAIKAAEERQDERKLAITTFMGECDTLMYASAEGYETPLCTHRSMKQRELFNTKQHALDHPDHHSAYVSLSAPAKQFLLKEAAA